MAALTLRGRRIHLPRIPVFRVFYSLTYTLLYFITLVFLAITPVSMSYASIEQNAIQYCVMLGSTYLLTVIIAIFIYSSRLYTNRSAMSAVGKAYIAIEDGEVTKAVRKMIVKQLHRSAIVAWESRPRDMYGEIIVAQQHGILPQETASVGKNDYLVGTEIRVDPQNPPWGDVQHPGWSSPSHSDNNKTPHVQFDTVIAEMPHLIEARAVSLAPPDPLLTPVEGQPQPADPLIVDALKRSPNMPVRDYLTQLSFLGLITPKDGASFLPQYEKARFSGKAVPVEQFDSLMAAFAAVLSGMTFMDPTIVDEVREQTLAREQDGGLPLPHLTLPTEDQLPAYRTPSDRPTSPQSSHVTPVTAHEGRSSRAVTPYLQSTGDSEESLPSSVIHNTSDHAGWEPQGDSDGLSTRSYTLPSDAGSVIHHEYG
ncbi:hypothetical protein CLAFUW4_05979 [Fulvia fulva]|uniref:Defect at low temperature protein 1 n=1 Tax=Passalora fulva TaxID=5499 RepID=A0A9Q8P955_PASFU|nr:uncharacterized protein CLAFUR5_06123 [Fulvia fulva]KAK4624482.1 hypothetical protein CLAFUR4_05984 [Fulvia fulva]KAK4625698.1 hypothetical protein CLAFUR0_05987 [Fulvia fulva]UJO17596.1 hypothetical protein CLAFUR5_06123 [Fulvia fulva]WPV15635.1 hypothetical protein CLAFUW4_05979 [Fulvia fulva]WPV30520.1 hypothetical protein CLAFUW7_05977 [Fulvia fulva]